MLSLVAEIMPLFLVRRLAARYLARWSINEDIVAVTARPGVYIDVTETWWGQSVMKGLMEENRRLRQRIAELESGP